jgi:hypothetical protein
MAKRPAARPAAAAVDSDDGSKKKPHVHASSHKIMIPPCTAPRSPKLSANRASQRAARNAEEAATSTLHIKNEDDFKLFVTPFAAAVALASTEKNRAVTILEVTTAIAHTGCKLKIGKDLKVRFVWLGFEAGQWVISRRVPEYGMMAFQKGSARDKTPNKWRLSPLPARKPLAKLS